MSNNKIRLGVYRPNSPQLLWVFSSVAEFYTNTIKQYSQKYCDKSLAEYGLISLPKDSIIHNYHLKKISEDIFWSFGKHPSLKPQVMNALLKSTDFPVIDNTLQECTGCHETKPLDVTNWIFEDGRWRANCRGCKTKANIKSVENRRQEVMEKGTFMCTRCGVEHPTSLRSQDRNTCMMSYNAARSIRTAEIAQTIDRSTVAGKDCVCGELFSPDNFKWKQTRWSSECNSCYNGHKYYEAYRERRRNDDLVGFLNHEANQQLRWRLANPVKTAEYNVYRQQSPEIRLKVIRQSAAKRDITFDEAAANNMLTLIGKSCYYCGFIDPERCNGLDRVDNDGGYFVDNVVSCCMYCNMAKKDKSVVDYVEKMCSVYLKSVADKVVINLDAEFPRLMYDSEHGRKLGVENYVNHEGQCYLCGFQGIVGTDRVDNKQSYTTENTRDCCSNCNYMKRNVPLDAFHLQAYRIYSLSMCRDELSVESGNLVTYSETVDENMDIIELPTSSGLSHTTTHEQTGSVPKRLRHNPQHCGYTVTDVNSGELVAEYHSRILLMNDMRFKENQIKNYGARYGRFVINQRWEVAQLSRKEWRDQTNIPIHSDEYVIFIQSDNEKIVSGTEKLSQQQLERNRLFQK